MDESLVAQYPDLEREHFWWATRRRLVTSLVDDVANPGARVLDVGCGSGMTAAELARGGADVLGVDLEIHGDHDRWPGVELRAGDYMEIAQGLGEFDVVLALDAIEHFEDESAVVSRLAANVGRGGHLIVTVPAYQLLWSSHDETNRHYRRYTSKRLAAALQGSGLHVQRCGYIFMGLFLPKLLLAGLERVRSSGAPTGTDVSGWANSLAASYFKWETRVGSGLTGFWPFGTSVVAVASRSSH